MPPFISWITFLTFCGAKPLVRCQGKGGGADRLKSTPFLKEGGVKKGVKRVLRGNGESPGTLTAEKNPLEARFRAEGLKTARIAVTPSLMERG